VKLGFKKNKHIVNAICNMNQVTDWQKINYRILRTARFFSWKKNVQNSPAILQPIDASNVNKTFFPSTCLLKRG
jgi:hypothetical protein